MACRLDPQADAATPAFGDELAHRLFDEPCRVEGRDIPVAARLAWSVAPEDPGDAATLLQNAEAALQFARASGRNAKRFDAEVRAHSVGLLNLEHRLRFALERNQFELYYQAQIDHGRIIGAEALLRWRHPRDGFVSPAHFIPLAEETGLILPLGEWVLKTACQCLASWALQPALAPLSLAVNVSPRQFHQSGFVAQVLAALAGAGADGRQLKLEMTEGLLLEDVEDTIDKMGQLKGYGVPLALTAQRMTFLLTGEGREAYDLWATELERFGLWAAPFEPRQEEGENGERGDVAFGVPGNNRRPQTQEIKLPPELAAEHVDVREPQRSRRGAHGRGPVLGPARAHPLRVGEGPLPRLRDADARERHRVRLGGQVRRRRTRRDRVVGAPPSRLRLEARFVVRAPAPSTPAAMEIACDVV